MDADKEEKLVAIAPYLFRYPDWDNEMKSLMGYGFCCGDGWYNILEALIRGIAALDTKKEVKVFQVKEKFGTLRFYLDDRHIGEIEDLISKAEAKSGVTCEVCGGKSTVKNKNGWYRSICDSCEEDDGK